MDAPLDRIDPALLDEVDLSLKRSGATAMPCNDGTLLISGHLDVDALKVLVRYTEQLEVAIRGPLH